MTGMSFEESAAFIEAYMGSYTTLRDWLITTGEFAIKNGFVIGLANRPRFFRLPEPDNPDYNQLIAQIKRWGGNAPIQNSSATITKLALCNIHKAVRGGKSWYDPKLSGKLKLTIHDEIVTEWIDSEVEIGKEIMVKSMSDAYYHFIEGVDVGKIQVLSGAFWQH